MKYLLVKWVEGWQSDTYSVSLFDSRADAVAATPFEDEATFAAGETFGGWSRTGKGRVAGDAYYHYKIFEVTDNELLSFVGICARDVLKALEARDGRSTNT